MRNRETYLSEVRFGKSTHISTISNSATHLRSYINSVITVMDGNSAPISPVTPHDRWRRRAECRRLLIERRYRRIEWPRYRRRRCPKRRSLHIERRLERSSAGIIASNDDCFMMFHNVLSVSWCFTSGSQCFTMFYMCFMMFYYV